MTSSTPEDRPIPAADATTFGPADRLLLSAARRAGPWLGVLALAASAMAVAELALPAVLGGAVDAIVSGGDTQVHVLWCAAIVAMLVAADAGDDLATGMATARCTAWLRHHVTRHLVDAGPTAAPPAGEVATRLVGNASEAGRMAPEAVRVVVNVLTGIGGTIALWLIHPWLAVTFLSGMPVLLVLVRAFTRDASELAHRYLDAQGAIAQRLAEAVGGARTIAAAGTTEREAERVLAPLPELRRQGMGMWRAQTRMGAQDVLLVALLEVAVLAVGGLLLADGRITVGELLAAGQYVLLAASLGSIVGAATRLARARGAAARIADVLAAPLPRYGARRLPGGRGRLELRGVCARAARGETELDGIDLTVEAGELVALVGAGGEPSLLAALAGRQADPQEGEILLDGVPLPALARAELRGAVAYGFERPALLGGTVAGAIAFGVASPSDEAVVAGARAACADGFIRRLPDAYATPLERAPMSGGERQRLGLARAFAHGGRLLVLDDAATSLDSITEHEIGTVLARGMDDRTRIVVAQRASTAARADRVVWLRGGRVEAQGRHTDLWLLPGYRALFEAAG